METHPIDEIKRIRHELGAEAGFDVRRIFDQLRSRQANSGQNYVRRAPKRIVEGNSPGATAGTPAASG